MVWYKYKDEYPTNGLPSRIRIDDGSTRTSLWEYSDEELSSLGLTTVSDPPFYNPNTQDLIWNNQTSSWSVTTTTDPVKIASAWEKNEIYKNSLKLKLLQNVNIYIENGGTISTYFNGALTILDNINKENYEDPFNFEWQHPRLVGYTDEVAVGISSIEYTTIHRAFVEFIQETYIPNQNF